MILTHFYPKLMMYKKATGYVAKWRAEASDVKVPGEKLLRVTRGSGRKGSPCKGIAERKAKEKEEREKWWEPRFELSLWRKEKSKGKLSNRLKSRE